MTQTIFALATARGKAGVAIVRLSGPDCLMALQRLGVEGLIERRVSLRKLRYNGDVIDEALVVYFPAGASFTGEAVAELHTHGSVAVVSRLLDILSGFPGLRIAAPGEFTRRALENGVLDLAQVEGLADLIDAETEAQRKQAQRVLSGALGELAANWRKTLVRAAALIEATIDFVDEDVPVDVRPEVASIIDSLNSDLEEAVAGSRSAERVRDGFEVAIIGAPNVGKSSLLNVLAGRKAALTSSIAGTTRDVIEVRMDIGGLAVTLLDTAGLRETTDEVEREGVSLARTRAKAADLRILLLGPDESADPYEIEEGDIVVWSKADLTDRPDAISSKTGYGIDRLIDGIQQRLSEQVAGASLIIRARQRNAMIEALGALRSARGWLLDENALEFAAADLRAASHALGMLVGTIGVESLLDEIFSSFCIGK